MTRSGRRDLDERDGRTAVCARRHVEPRAFGKTRHDVEDALLIIDDHQQWSRSRHAPPTLSKITAASATRSARNWNGGTSRALACSWPNCPATLRRRPDTTTIGTGVASGDTAARHRVGCEDPAIDERRAQAAGAVTRKRFVGPIGSAHAIAPGGERRRDVVAVGLIDVRDQDACF